jgi:S-adenosylmethionine synthetase
MPKTESENRRPQEVETQINHIVDKVLIIAGRSAPRFGGGSILKPLSVVMGGRASKLSGKPVNRIIEDPIASDFQKTMKT